MLDHVPNTLEKGAARPTFVYETAGEAISRGAVVANSSSANDTVVNNPVDGDMPIGVAWHDAVAGQQILIVTSGECYVLPDLNLTPARQRVIYSSSTTAGRVQEASAVPSQDKHNREVGHWCAAGTGNGVLTKAIIHFN